MGTIRIAPSIAAADYGHLERAVRAVEQGGADMVHLDVMDGHFVPNLTFGPDVAAAIRRLTSLPLDAHLMVEDPEAFLGRFAAAGCDYITVHPEATRHLQGALAEIRRLGKKAGAALNPATPLTAVRHVLRDLDLLLVMSVNPGFSGQEFLPEAALKVREAREMLDRSGYAILLEVDGGIGPENVALVAKAGADAVVSGSAVFRAADVPGRIREIRERASLS